MNDIFKRVWENLIGRSEGPLDFRLFIQPTVAAIFAIRAGLKDARAGRPAFLWDLFTTSGYPLDELAREGWNDVSKVFILAVILDSIYQLIVHRGVYILELVIMATGLAILPYILVRGPVNRVAQLLSRKRQATNRELRPKQGQMS